MSHRLPSEDLAAWVHDLVHHFEHVLPAQAPIKDFVHHNTLHGFQHLPFRDALAAAEAAIGAQGFLPEEESRAFLAQGRITPADLDAALSETPELDPDAPVIPGCTRRQAFLAILTQAIAPLPAAGLAWRLEAGEVRPELWRAALAALGLDPLAQAEESRPALPDETPEAALQRLHTQAEAALAGLLEQMGGSLTLRGLLLALTGRDVLETLRPYLIRHLAAYMDQGLAAWTAPQRGRGFYAAWRASAEQDPHWELNDLPEWELLFDLLPDDAAACVLKELDLLGLAEERWAAYLETLAKELPGWSGMVLWRHTHPGYEGLPERVEIMDYLAVRLVLERLYAQALMRRHFRVEASLPGLRGYFHHHSAELLVRLALFRDERETPLPEWLQDQGHRLVREATAHRGDESDADWLPVARLIDAACVAGDGRAAARAWPLARLAQALKLRPEQLDAASAQALLAALDDLTPARRGWVWLQAYEGHYREDIFTALAANHGRSPAFIPEAQLMFCMDDREEGLRRHLEEIAPQYETLGAAAHFNVPHNWRGLDHAGVTALAPVAPVVVVPAHEVCELPRLEQEPLFKAHQARLQQHHRWQDALNQGTRANPIAAALLACAAAPGALAVLAGKMLAPALQGRWSHALAAAFDKTVDTRIQFTAPNDSPEATPERTRLGFTDVEQADRVQALLRNTGLTRGFAPLVVIAGHVSHNQNNPHASAYNCGACAGRYSGPNARLVASMANRPEVRALLAERGIVIPAATWFLGAEHDTCNDVVEWFDLADVPARLQAACATLRADVARACQLHAQERCRRFMSAPLSMSPAAAHRHVAGRAADLSQARPELGHATNACAFIGRRSMSRGAFFDRRAFLISYDPSIDPDGAILERHLVINGAVGAGISLEYYFSTVNNARYGSGTKVMHNVAGLFGVMEGASSDLRTGLPRQMIEIHEAMRLLVVVEHDKDVITAIYMRQPAVRELVGNGWLQVAAKHPETGEMHRFLPDRGWIEWSPRQTPPKVKRSADWFRGQREALPTALLDAPVAPASLPARSRPLAGKDAGATKARP